MEYDELSLLTDRLTTSLEWIANALHHPDHMGGGLLDETGGPVNDVSSAITGVTSGLFAISASLDRLAEAVSRNTNQEVSDG